MPKPNPTPQPLLMLTLPSSGSSWLCNCIAQALNMGPAGYYREFFNPALCPRYLEPIFSRHFASELVPTHFNVQKTGDSETEACMELFARSGYVFTKSTMNPNMGATFAKHFGCFVLLRSYDDTFPPKRGRVYSFYNQLYYGLNFQHTGTLVERCRVAHDYLTSRLEEMAMKLKMPVLRYSELMHGTASELEEVLRPVAELGGHFALGGAVTNILETRKHTPRTEWVEG